MESYTDVTTFANISVLSKVYHSASENQLILNARYLDPTPSPSTEQPWNEQILFGFNTNDITAFRLVTDSSNTLYIANPHLRVIHVYKINVPANPASESGQFIRTAITLGDGKSGSGNYSFSHPAGLAFHNGVLYVVDKNNDRVLLYDVNDY